MFKKLLLLAAAVSLGMTAAAAHAQAGVYVNPIATRISNSVGDTGPYALLGQNSTSQVFYGVAIGGYYDFFHSNSVAVGVDVRDTLQHANNASINGFLLAGRVSANPFRLPFRPYFMGSVGAGTTRSPYTTTHITKGVYGAYGGLDYAVQKHVDIRIIEVSYSTLTTISSETIGGTRSIPASRLIGFSSGLVFRFP